MWKCWSYFIQRASLSTETIDKAGYEANSLLRQFLARAQYNRTEVDLTQNTGLTSECSFRLKFSHALCARYLLLPPPPFPKSWLHPCVCITKKVVLECQEMLHYFRILPTSMSAQTTTPIKVVHKEDAHKGACRLERGSCSNVRQFVPDIIMYAVCSLCCIPLQFKVKWLNDLASFSNTLSAFKVACEKRDPKINDLLPITKLQVCESKVRSLLFYDQKLPLLVSESL